MKKVLTILLLSVFFGKSYGQDPNFSQFFVSPLTLNPALTGKFDGNFRVSGNYRNQWPTINNAFRTATASFDLPILTGKLSEIDRWGVGVLALTDKSGNGILNNNYVSLSTAYHKGLDEDGYHQLGVGFQATYSMARMDGTKLNLGDELDLNGTWTNPTMDPLNNRVYSKNYFDLATGIFYNGATNDWNNFYVGASMYHVNKPKESFSNAHFYLNPRITVQAGGYFPIGEGTTLHLSGMHSNQAKATNTLVGGAAAFSLGADEMNTAYLYAGGWLRVGDAIIPYLGVEFSDLRFGVSYDVNISSLKPASNTRGGIEISLIYIKRPSDPFRRRLACPMF